MADSDIQRTLVESDWIMDILTQMEIMDRQLRYEQMMENIRRRSMARQSPQQGPSMPPGSGSILEQILGAQGGTGTGTSAAGTSAAGTPAAGTPAAGTAGSAGMPAAGMAGIIGAAIVAQHLLSNATDTKFEGVKTNDAFAGHFGTEPWLAFVHDKLGIAPTAGEKFDAAVANKDWGKAMARAPAMANYWADPASSWAETGGRAVLGDKYGKWVNPIGALLSLLG